MALGIGFGVERLGCIALKYPRICTVCIFALLVLIGTSLPRLSFDDDIHRVFLSDSQLSQAQRDYEANQSPLLATVFIYVTSPAVLNAKDMTLLRELSINLEFVEGVTGVASPYVLRWPPDADAPSGRPIFKQQIDSDFADDLSAFEALGTGLSIFLNETLTAMVMSVSVDTDQKKIANAVSEINAELRRSLPDNLSASVTGEEVISTEIVSGLKDDLVALNLWGALIVTIVTLILLRDPRMALLAVVPAILGASSVLALSVWLDYPITVLSNVIPILLLVLGVADGIHLVRHFKEDTTINQAIEAVGPACALTALTTAFAFASILLSGNAQLFEFAILGAFGTLLSFIVFIVTFALIGRTIKQSSVHIPHFTTSIARRLALLGTGYPRSIVSICILLFLVTFVGFTQTKAWFPLYQNLPTDSVTVITNDSISDNFGGVFQMIVETSDDWEETREIVEQLEIINGQQTVFSEVNFARWLGHLDTRPTKEELEKIPQGLIKQLQTNSGGSRIFVSVPEPMRNKRTLAQFDTIHEAATAAGADRIIGLPTIMRFEAISLIEQLSIGLIFAALGATFLVAFAFRSVRLLPILFIPNVLPLMLTAASLHIWAQGQLNPTAVLALTIAFGIAVDDSVHFLSRFFTAQKQGYTSHQSIDFAARSAGQAMVLTSILLTAGLCITLFSDFTPIRLFGGMMIITLWAALLTDLLLLPVLLTWKRTPNASA